MAASLVGCGHDHYRNADTRLAERVGPERIDAAALSLRCRSPSAFSSIPISMWPDAIRSLEPEAVYVSHEGVYIRLRSFFVTESGVFVASPEAQVTTGSGDPLYIHIRGYLYWYKIEG